MTQLMKAIVAIALTYGRAYAALLVTALALGGCDGTTVLIDDSGSASSAPTEQGTDPGTDGTTGGTDSGPATGSTGEGDVDGDGYLAEDGEGNVIDCNDEDASINPGAADDSCDGIDQDCDGEDGSDLRAAGEGLCGGVDQDGDGYLDVDGSGATVDCDDLDATVFPGATEIADDGIDQDCDGEDLVSEPADTGDTGAAANPNDMDGDGHEAEAAGGDDCDDLDATIFTGATEVAYDGIDQDCDELDLVDVDCDGVSYVIDCDDNDPAVSPLESEVAGNGIDDDCDGTIDDGSDPDVDGDGVAASLDCDDADATVYPGATEVEDDGIDQDCDGEDSESPVASVEEGAAACLNGSDDDLDGLTDADDEGCIAFVDEDADLAYFSYAMFDFICDESGCFEADPAYGEGNAFLVGDSPFGPWDELQIDNELELDAVQDGYYVYDPIAAGANDFEGTLFTLVSALSVNDETDAVTVDDQSDWAWASYGDVCEDLELPMCYDNSGGNWDSASLQMSYDSSTGDLYAGDVEI